jgi:RNA polymerase primary sigma factor
MDLAEQTRKILSTLTPREEKILRLRFGISEHGNFGAEESRDSLELSRERVRQHVLLPCHQNAILDQHTRLQK